MTESCPPSLPRLPVMGWDVFRGERNAPLPSLLSHGRARLTTSGRAAILAALRAIGLQRGERVLLPTYHCPTMIAPTVTLGGVPLFYPLDARGAPRLDWIAQQDLRGVRAMLAAHFFGVPQPMARMRQFCDDRGIALIEDCAHAFFGRSDGRTVGGWGDHAIGSLTKFFPVSEGGVLLSGMDPGVEADPRPLRDEIKAVIDALETAAAHRRLPGLNGPLRALFALKTRLRQPAAGGPDSPRADAADPEIALPARAITWVTRGLLRVTHEARIVSRRRDNFLALSAALSGVDGMAPLITALPADAAPYVMPLLVDTSEPLYQALRAQRVPVFRWCLRWPGTPQIDGDVAQHWSRNLLQLGCHQDLSPADIAHIARVVIEGARR